MNSSVHLPTFTEQTRANEAYQCQNDDDQDETNDPEKIIKQQYNDEKNAC